jgi:hypothetical protein
MILYNYDREVITDFISYNPRSCFIMTQLGSPLPGSLIEIRKFITAELEKRKLIELDANSYIQGKDFLNKIWKIILSVPMGIAIVTNEMKLSTISNIFYEVGVLNALGKEIIVIKTKDFPIPSDFIRTEYIEFDDNFQPKINNFFDQVFALADHYDVMAESLENNPNLSIDYWRRAYLITGKDNFLRKAKKSFKENNFDTQSKLFINNFLSTKLRLAKKKKTNR